MALNTTPYRGFAYPALNRYSGGGATGVQSALTGSNPAEMRAFAEQVVRHSAVLVQLVEALQKKRQQLTEIWPEGSTSDAAAERTATGLTAFLDSIQPMVGAAQTITAAAHGIDAAQTTTRTTLAAAESVVSALASNPWTQGAAAATANGTIGSLSGFMSGVGSMLTALGETGLGTQTATLGTLIGGIQSLLSALGVGADGDADPRTDPTGYTADLYDPRTQSYQPYAYNPSTGAYTADTGYPTYADRSTDGLGPYHNPYAGGSTQYPDPRQLPAAGAYATFTDPATGQLKVTTVDPSSGWPVGPVGLEAGTGGAGGMGGMGGVGEWVPVDAASGGGGTPMAGGTDTTTAATTGEPAGSSSAGSGAAGSVSGDDPMQITVSSGGETVSFRVDETNPTDITAEVGPAGGETEVRISVNPTAV